MAFMRESKDYVNFTCRLERAVAKMLDEVVKETGLSKTATVERAVRLYYERYCDTGKA